METNWISVKDNLPETWSMLSNQSDSVLVHYYTYEGVDVYGEPIRYSANSIGYYDGSENKWMVLDTNRFGSNRYMEVDVDYWMKIPAIPKGGAK